jgi:phage-related protein
MTDKIGLEAIWDNANFNKGQADYINGLTAASGATSQASSSINQIGATAGQTGNIFSGLAGMLGMTTGGFLTQIGVLAIAKQAWDTVTGAVGDFISYMFTAEDSAVKVASRITELNIAAQAMGQQIGMDGNAINALVKQLTDMEISQTDANKVVAEFARYGLNMSDVLKLATVAENASVIAGKSATETFTDFASAIEMLRIRSLKTNGIIFDANDAYQIYADTLGKDVDALTETEKQQAFLNMTIEKGANLVGLHAIAMTTAAEQMDHLKGKVLPDLANAMGAPFQGAFFNIVKGLNDVLGAFTKMISEGGVLYPILVEIGAVFKVLTEPLLGFGRALNDLSESGLSGFADSVVNTIDAAVDWGFNLVSNFASGMINAASTVLVGAINFIADMLTFWMAPGSPPKFIPHIDEWGSEAMASYLKGFSEADFGILNDLQGPLQAALGSLADMGVITKQASSQLFVNLSEGMIKAISAGQLTDDILNQLAQSGGIYGDELVDLAKKEFALSGAEKAVIDTEKALEDAKKRSAEAGAAVNTGLIEYNQMLRSGAGKQALTAKLAEINANKKAKTEADKDITAKQTALDLAKQQLIATQDQISAIKDMIKVMIDLNKQQIAAVTPETPEAKAAGGAAKKAGGVTAGKVEPFDPSKITNAFADAVDSASEAIRVKWGIMTSNIIFAWDTAMRNIQIALDKTGLPAKFEEIKKAVSGAFDWIRSQTTDVGVGLKRWWSQYGGDISWFFGELVKEVGMLLAWIGKTALPGFFESVGGAWLFLKTTFFMVLNTIGAIFSTIHALFTGDTGKLKEIWDNWLNMMRLSGNKFWEALGKIFNISTLAKIWKPIDDWFGEAAVKYTAWSDSIKAGWDNFWSGLGTTITTKAAEMKTNWDTHWANLGNTLSTAWENIKTTISNAWDTVTGYLSTKSTEMATNWNTHWDAVSLKVTEIWNSITTWISTKFEEIKKFIDTELSYIKTGWQVSWDAVSTKVTEVWTSIVTGISSKVTEVKDAVAAIFTGPDGLFAKFSGWVSEMVQHGKDLIGGLVSGVTSAAQGLIDSVVAAVQGALNTVRDLLHIQHSPSELFKLYGRELMEGLEIGITANMDLPTRAMSGAMVQTLSPAAIPITMGSTNNYYQPNIMMNNQINNGMSVAQLESFVLRTVRKGMKK